MLSLQKKKTDPMEFPHVDLPVDIIAWTDVTEDILNIYKQSCRLKACIFALCLEGSLKVSINLMDTEVKQGDFITLLPGSLIQFYGQKGRVRLGFVGFSENCHSGAGLMSPTPSVYPNLAENPIVHANDTIASYMADYFALLGRITTGPYPPDTNMARNILNNLLYVVNRMYIRLQLGSDRARSRAEEICHRLVQLVFEHYAHERRAQFYADKMGISLQHLSTTVKQVTGRNVMDIIAHVVMVDVKAKLKSTNMTVQEIAYSLNFPNPSFFGKYFKRHMGMTPQEYRNS